MAPLEALTDEKLTDSERRVLFALYSYSRTTLEYGVARCNPTLNQLSDRCLITDVARISKLTKRLATLGWLEKSKTSFQQRTPEYTLEVPQRLKDIPRCGECGRLI